MSVETISHVVDDAMHTLPNNKACVLDLISADLKNASLRLAPLLALSLTGFMIHGILPNSMLSILLVPVLKDKAGRVSCMDNYRPIALAIILSKVVERIMLDRVMAHFHRRVRVGSVHKGAVRVVFPLPKSGRDPD